MGPTIAGIETNHQSVRVKIGAMGATSSRWIKNPKLQIASIAICIAILASCAWTVPASHVQAHNILHHLNFIPLMIAGMLFGWRGAIISMLFAGIVYAPHLYTSWDVTPVDASDQLVELSIFGGAGVIAGFLADRERRQRFRLERTTGQLEDVYQELQQNIEQLKKAERLYAAGQLAASVAHEIRNPLASISGAAGILKRGHATPENVQDCLEIIEKESHRLNKLLTNFLIFARPRAPRFQPADLKAVIHSVTALGAHTGTPEPVRTIVEAPDDLPIVRCDPELLKQVLLNLLINAKEATPPGGIVRLSITREAGRIRMAVRDEGCGVKPEEQDKIFDPFFTTKENGTGLGLSIASKIVEQHGGVLTAVNNADKGMTFRLELPLEQATL